MASFQQKIKGIEFLVEKGYLTKDEAKKMIACLSSDASVPQPPLPSADSLVPPPRQASTPQEMYEEYIQKVIAKRFKCPGSIKFPSLASDMIKVGNLKIQEVFTYRLGSFKIIEWVGYKDTQCRYIRTFVDAQNLRAAYRRTEVCIIVDNNLKPLSYVTPVWLSKDKWVRPPASLL